MALDPLSYAKASEHSHQVALLMWANMACNYGLKASLDNYSYNVFGHAQELLKENNDQIPQLKWLHAIHNQGHGDKIRGGKAKAEGVKPGVFDLFLPVPISLDGEFNGALPRRLYHGLYLELKVGKNQPSEKQNEFAADMGAAGYQTAVAWGWLEAREKILDYLQIKC